MIDFNRPYITGNELIYIEDVLRSGKLSGNGVFTKKCQHYFEHRYGFKKCLLTTSCTDALEMAAILCDIGPCDEVIIPSYTFVSTALAFVRQGAKIVFADSCSDSPNIDLSNLESLITPRTKAIVVMHYAGISCDMNKLCTIASKFNLFVVEDAAQAIDSYYNGKPLGSFGHFSAFSFHETKNIISGEGGMLVINDERFIHSAEIVWEKGTNRAQFFRGEINKYGWVDIGSSFLPSEVIAGFLWAQLERLDEIQKRRKSLWDLYHSGLVPLACQGYFKLPVISSFSQNNAHMFYLVMPALNDRTKLIEFLKSNNITAVFHYQSLHRSEYYRTKHDGRELQYSDMFTDCIIRLPFYYDLTFENIHYIVECIYRFYGETYTKL
jgi:dTDP-4-amino-4,6-dideoxygalactose transaminase